MLLATNMLSQQKKCTPKEALQSAMVAGQRAGLTGAVGVCACRKSTEAVEAMRQPKKELDWWMTLDVDSIINASGCFTPLVA